MSSGGAFGGARGYQPKPPEKGVFPLDHFGECKHIKEQYIECLKQHNSDADACRDVAKKYLECRMETNLMAQQDLKDLGFAGDGSNKNKTSSKKNEAQRRKEEQGFVAGLQKFKD